MQDQIGTTPQTRRIRGVIGVLWGAVFGWFVIFFPMTLLSSARADGNWVREILWISAAGAVLGAITWPIYMNRPKRMS